jgi:hypothetical protein
MRVIRYNISILFKAGLIAFRWEVGSHAKKRLPIDDCFVFDANGLRQSA